jgi:acetyl esterase/lipase
VKKTAFALLMLACSTASVAAEPDYADLLSRKPDIFDVKISPDGVHLAAKMFVDGKQTLVFLDSKTMKPTGVARFAGLIEVGEYRWVNNERVVFQMVESQPWLEEPLYFGELYGVNTDGSKGQILFGYRAGETSTGTHMKPKREAKEAWAEFIESSADEDGFILIKSTPMSKDGERLPEVLAMNVYSGKTKSFGRVPVPRASVLAGPHGKPRVAAGFTPTGEREVYVKEDNVDGWTKVPSAAFGEIFDPIAVTADNKSLYVFDNKGQDKSGVFQFDLTNGKYSEVYTDPVVDVSSVKRTSDKRSVYAAEVNDGRPAYILLNQDYKEAKVFKDLLGAFPGEDVTITSSTTDQNQYVVAVGSDVSPVAYYRYDVAQNSLALLTKSSAALSGIAFAPTEPVQFDSFDGMKIHGYLTQSPAKSAEKPLVVYVHGGPHGVRDTWGFDRDVQLMALSGYNVLQVNYRGSGGYGTKYEESGYLQWGNNIQRDIIAGTEWAIAQGHGKAGNVCIVGGSFGAYSVVQSAILKPNLYRCGVAVAGVYDLSLMYSDGDIRHSGYGETYLKRVIGQDKQQLASYSPSKNVTGLTTHLLIAHGKKDERAPISHAEALMGALKQANKPFEYLEFNDEAHGFYSTENQLIYKRKLQEYLASHLKK